MKYNSSHKPLVCMQTQSTCYKGTRTMAIKGILWHSTAANNPTLKRYIQPSDKKPLADTYSKAKWLEILGKNTNGNDWNHIYHEAGMNCWVGTLADGTVTTIQTMPWNYRPWGCGKGPKGSCNSGWIQFEICEGNLSDKTYFNKIYKEACEITAYLCKKYKIDPHGTVDVNGIQVPPILCHQDSYKLGLGCNHSDIYHWFPKHGKNMETVRDDVAALINGAKKAKKYEVITSIHQYETAKNALNQTKAKRTKLTAGTYYIYNKYPKGYNGAYNITTDKTGSTPGMWINPKENIVITGLKIKNKPKKITYKVGEKLDTTGLVVKAVYSDKTTKKVTNFKVTGFSSKKVGKVTIKVSYQGKITTFIVKIK